MTSQLHGGQLPHANDLVIDAGCIVCGKRLCNGRVSVRPSVRLSRRSIARKQQRRAARLPRSSGARGGAHWLSIDICCRRYSAAAGGQRHVVIRGTGVDADLLLMHNDRDHQVLVVSDPNTRPQQIQDSGRLPF